MKSLVDAAQLSRAAEQVAAVEVGPRRIYCDCGCGRWWYWPPKTRGRPRTIATHDCALRRRAQLRAEGRAVYLPRSTPQHPAATPPTMVERDGARAPAAVPPSRAGEGR